MGFNFTEALKGFAVTAGFAAFCYFVIPFIFPVPIHQVWFFAIVMTTSNFFAIVLSWYYFSKSRCYQDEGNIITMYGYKIAGASATHLFIFILRISGNVVAIVSLLLFPDTLNAEFPSFFNIKVFLLSISFATALYFYEMINNIIAVSRGVDFKCKERSLLCGMTKDPLFCDF